MGPSANRNGGIGDNNCFYYSGKNHYILECDELKNNIRTGYVKLSSDENLRNGDSGYIPGSSNGSTIKERIEKQKMWKQNQFYCGFDENDYIAKPEIPMYPAQFLNQTESSVNRQARLEKELKQKEDELELRKLRLEKEEMKQEQNKSSGSS